MGPSRPSFPVPQSGCSAIEWPAIATGRNATLLALQYQLQETQWWPEEIIATHQFQQIEQLVRHARNTVPFHATRLDESIDRRKLNREIWQRVPLLTREEVQKHGESLLSSELPADHGATTNQQSSGSTGRPVSVKISEIYHLFFAALNIRHYQWQDLDFRESVAAIRTIRANERENVRTNKGIPWVAGHASGPMALFDVVQPVSQQVAWLEKQKPTYLLTMPSNLKAILDEVEVKGLSLPSIQKVLTMSEIIPAELREHCADVLGVSIGDSYSAYEVGMIALQCPEYDHYHIQAESLMVEILNDNDDPCGVGEIGRVVVTDLHNFAMPLIRYDIGDYAEVGAACPCGRGLPVLKRILGRKRNMVVYPSGETSWPVPWLSSELMPLAPIEQIQLIQHTPEAIEIKLVTTRSLTAEEEKALVALFQERMHYPFNFNFVYVEAIERSAGGKFEDFISLADA